MALRQAEVPFRRGYDVGIGADLATGDPKAMAVTGPVSGVDGARGATTSFSIERIRSSEELQRSLQVHAEASYGVGAFSASARLDFAQKCHIETTSVFLAVTMNIELPYEQIDSPVLTTEAAKLVDQPELFAERYGNMFVRGIVPGGLLVASIKIEGQTEEDSKEIAAELKGGFGGFSAEARSTFSEKVSKHTDSVSILVYAEGGPMDLVKTFEKDLADPALLVTAMVAWASAFQSDAAGNAKPYRASLTPMVVAEAPLPPDPAAIQHAQDVLIECARRRSATWDQLSLLHLILDNKDRYDSSVSASFEDCQKAADGLQADLTTVARCASAAIDDAKKAEFPAEYAASHAIASYPTAVPSPLPVATSAAVTVPDLVAASSWEQVQTLCGVDLVPVQVTGDGLEPAPGFRVSNQPVPARSQVPKGTSVQVVVYPVDTAPSLYQNTAKLDRIGLMEASQNTHEE